jgi:putative sigma-54 modulation protein
VQIEVKGRNTAVTEALRRHVEDRFRNVAKQVSELARLEVELRVERNPAIADGKVAEANLYLKGITLRARERSADLTHSVDLVAEKLARQVKRHREKRRGRRDQQRDQQAGRASAPGPEAQ